MKQYITFTFYTIAIIGLLSCGQTNKNSSTNTSDSINISISKVNVLQVTMDSISTSYETETSILDNKIAVIDKYFCYLYTFSPDGHLLKRQLGQGNAKNETTVGKIAGHCFSKDGDLILLGFQGDMYYYDSNINLVSVTQTDYSKRSMDDLKTTECYNNPIDYTHCYDNLTCREYDGKVFFNVMLMTPVYNIVSTPSDQLEKAYNIMANNPKVKKKSQLLIKGLPTYYKTDTKKKAAFTQINFDIDKDGNIYVAFEADSTIYVYNKKQELISKFGRGAHAMSQDYTYCNSLEDFGKNYQEEHATKGHYTSLEYIDETGILLRTYQRGGDSKDDGMQIYKDGILIGDVAVPKSMKVAGYISPYYYSQVVPEEAESKLKIFRFKL